MSYRFGDMVGYGTCTTIRETGFLRKSQDLRTPKPETGFLRRYLVEKATIFHRNPVSLRRKVCLGRNRVSA
ncbi:hypothetical protein [Aerosakkonema funiforme]|uniref:hypothetical protein n=1 Tax=Aerosakkonema funiforme TaxID=1246630 RepID=UPI0035B92262